MLRKIKERRIHEFLQFFSLEKWSNENMIWRTNASKKQIVNGQLQDWIQLLTMIYGCYYRGPTSVWIFHLVDISVYFIWNLLGLELSRMKFIPTEGT